jgi:transcription elongation factor GreA
MTEIDETTGDVHLTMQGRQDLADRARKLRDEVLPRLVEQRGSADDDGSVRADWERATSELTRVTAVLATARPTGALPDDPRTVELGEFVAIRRVHGTDLEHYRVVHPAEAITRGGLVSARSPLGQALLGRRIGDEVDVAAPGGSYRCVIISATRSKVDPPADQYRPQTESTQR